MFAGTATVEAVVIGIKGPRGALAAVVGVLLKMFGGSRVSPGIGN